MPKSPPMAGNSWADRVPSQVSSQMKVNRHFTNSTLRIMRRDAASGGYHRILLVALAAGTPEEAATIAFEHVMACP